MRLTDREHACLMRLHECAYKLNYEMEDFVENYDGEGTGAKLRIAMENFYMGEQTLRALAVHFPRSTRDVLIDLLDEAGDAFDYFLNSWVYESYIERMGDSMKRIEGILKNAAGY